MKALVRHLILTILTVEACLVLKRYKSKIIGIAGSVGKTSTKEAIALVLKKNTYVRASSKSYNSEFGVPLTILDCDTAWNNPFGWFKNIIEGILLLIIKTPYPEWLVLEIGSDRPGDVARLTSWLTFDLVVITALPGITAHLEFYNSPEALVKEESALAFAVKPEGVVFLNSDDNNIQDLAKKLEFLSDDKRPKIITYGLNEQADIRGANFRIDYDTKNKAVGSGFEVRVATNHYQLKITDSVGLEQMYPMLVALGVARELGLDSESAVTALKNYHSPVGRARLITGIKDSLLIDDSYNAAPPAVQAAIRSLAQIETTGRKIAVLGDMLELGEYTIEAHRDIGVRVVEVCDLLLLVGPRSKFTGEGAQIAGMAIKNIKYFDTALEAGLALQNLIKKGDVILIKGSQGMRMEKVVEEVMAHPEDKEKLLCRQDLAWQNR
ncbi:MAG: UDP-N-acetylmuramoyl-tripeptide--D-alanyl-D-alanine ligase [Candidatus Vogelbacteria bacterium]|nr:UDP-N-acetylmuramoyl-tripeptide--D-alanyl-D-alanine ligase [Candidatus Vogelbacteria bacterium]